MTRGSLSTAAIRATLLRAVLDLDGPAVPTPEAWELWRDIAGRERVVPQLHDVAVRDLEHLGEERVAEAESLHVDVAALSVRLERALLDVVDRLDANGISSAVLKGLATSHLDHRDPSRRQFGDIDLLVDPADLGRAQAVLAEGGWRQTVPLPRYRERFEHALTMGGVGIAELDLHHRLAPRALGLRVPTSELLAQSEVFWIAERPLTALDRTGRLVHAAVHAVASRGRFRKLSSLADVLLLSRADETEPEAVLMRCEAWRLRPLVEAGIRLAHADAQVGLPDAWSEAMAMPLVRRDRLIERAYLGERRHLGWEEMAHLRALRSWGDRVRYAHGHLRAESAPGAGGTAARLRYLRGRLRDPMRSDG